MSGFSGDKILKLPQTLGSEKPSDFFITKKIADIDICFAYKENQLSIDIACSSASIF